MKSLPAPLVYLLLVGCATLMALLALAGSIRWWLTQ
jgi:hypothetical protein